MTRRPTSPIGEDIDLHDSKRQLYPDLENDYSELTYSSGCKSNELTFEEEEEDCFVENITSTAGHTPYHHTVKSRHSVNTCLETSRVSLANVSRNLHDTKKYTKTPNTSFTKIGSSSEDTFEEQYNYVKKFFDENGFLVFSFIALCFLIFYFFWPRNEPKSAQLSKEFLSDLRVTIASKFNDDKRVQAIFLYMFQILTNLKTQAPVVVLLSGTTSKTNLFLEQFAGLLQRHSPTVAVPYEISIDVEHMLSRRELEDQLFGYLKKSTANRVVVMRGIDDMALKTPLFLHAISDPDTAPYKHLLAVVTVSPPLTLSGEKREESKVQSSRCDEQITDHLLERWSANLEPDKIYPIISRITAILMCFN